MRHLLVRFAAAAALAASLALPAHAHSTDSPSEAGAHDGHGAVSSSVTAGDLHLSGGWTRAMLPGQPAGGGYLTVTNNGDEADRLLGGSTPSAGRVEIHTMAVVDDVMTMRPLADGLEIGAGATVELEPGGLHLMFMEVDKPFSEGDTVSVALEFERAGSVEIVLPVRAARGGGHNH